MTKYRHKKTGNIYYFESYGKMKEMGVWIDCVIYWDSENKKYVRSKWQFENKFEPIKHK